MRTQARTHPRIFMYKKQEGFIVMGGIFGGYAWSRLWDGVWASQNVGKLYKDMHAPTDAMEDAFRRI